MKAFLSHSSVDAEFVRAVASELGRQFTWIDEQAFATGDEFISGMERGLAQSGVFVLFASRASLASVFVEFEVDVAREKVIRGAIERVLVLVLDPAITFRDLPVWLQRAKVSEISAPKPAARLIRFALDEIARQRQRSVFVGRARETRELEAKLLPVDGSPPPRAFLVSGLPGIGRRTLALRVARDHWSLPRSIDIRLESGDSLGDIAVKLADRFEPYNSVDRLRVIADRITNETAAEQRVRIATYLRASLEGHELPVFVDDGGMLDNEGAWSDVTRALLDILAAERAVHFCLVSSRRPSLPPLGPGSVAVAQVSPLSETETKQLVSSLAGRAGLSLTSDVIGELASVSAGYPPSAFHVVELVRDYGAPVALGDRSRLTGSRLTPLMRYLQHVSLSELEKRTIRLLAASSPMPLSALGAVLSASSAGLATVLSRLIDASLVYPDEQGDYLLAEPMREAVSRELGDLSRDEYALVAEALDAYLKAESGDVHRLEIARSLFRAHSFAGGEGSVASAFSLASDLIRTAERLYHRREYQSAAKYAQEAARQRPKNYDAKFVLVRALIKLGEFQEAERAIDSMRELKYLREAAFLSGFLERHRDRTKEAIAYYKTAVERGYTGLSVQRELAQCYLALGQVDHAKSHIERAAAKGGENRFVVDLQVRIALAERDERAAYDKLAFLERLDQSEFYLHRLSTVETTFGRNNEALEAARRAVKEAVRPTFAMLAQLVLCELKMSKVDEAGENLNRLDREFGNRHRDIRIGLRCRLEIARRRYTDALVLWESLQVKSRPVHMAIKRDAIAGALRGALADGKRVKLEEELAELNELLATVHFVEADALVAEDL